MAEAHNDKVPVPVPKKKKKKARKRRRWIWIVLQWIGIPILCLIALGAGLVIGYVYIGKQPMEDVYEIETWRHLYDLVFSET